MMLIPTTLAPSAIHGTGLFATAPIARGTTIWQFLPGLDVELDAALLHHANPAIASYLQRYSYPHYADPARIVLDGDNGRFMNHSDQPNTDFTDPLRGTALTDIPAGTELTCNYAEFAPGFVLD